MQELRTLGVDVLSPSDPRVVDHIGEFLFVASDRIRAVKLVQDRHLEAIRASDFLVVVCPDGYTGPSTSGEIMAATVLGVPIYSTAPVTDITMREYVQQISDFTRGSPAPSEATAYRRAIGSRRFYIARSCIFNAGGYFGP